MHYVSFHCSEGNRGSEADSVVAYYLSEFDVPIGRGSAVDTAIGSMDPMEGSSKGRMGTGRRPTSSLLINNVMSGGRVKGEHHSALGCESYLYSCMHPCLLRPMLIGAFVVISFTFSIPQIKEELLKVRADVFICSMLMSHMCLHFTALDARMTKALLNGEKQHSLL